MSQTIAFEPGRWYIVEAGLREIYGFPKIRSIRQTQEVERFYGREVCLSSDDTLTFIGNSDPDIKSKLVELATAL